jgi:hypothetical protein
MPPGACVTVLSGHHDLRYQQPGFVSSTIVALWCVLDAKPLALM